MSLGSGVGKPRFVLRLRFLLMAGFGVNFSPIDLSFPCEVGRLALSLGLILFVISSEFFLEFLWANCRHW